MKDVERTTSSLYTRYVCDWCGKNCNRFTSDDHKNVIFHICSDCLCSKFNGSLSEVVVYLTTSENFKPKEQK